MSQTPVHTDPEPSPEVDLTKAEHLVFGRRTPAWVLIVKWGLLALVVAGLVVVAQRLIEDGNWLFVVVLAFIAMCVLAVYGTRRAVPMKYLLPGLLLLVALQIWPIVYTVTLSFTNYGDGHLVSKEEAIQAIQANSVRQVEGSERYKLTIAVPEGADPATGEIVYLLSNAEGKTFVGTSTELKEIDAATVTKSEVSGKITAAQGYTPLDAKQVNARSTEIQDFAVPTDSGGGIKAIGLSEAFVGQPTMVYDAANDTITDSATGAVYVAKNARFVPQSGTGAALPQGWLENVGFSNYTNALTNSTLRAGLVKVLVWNVVFAAGTVITTFLLGMALALLMNDERLKGKGIYRSLMILPYALPVYVTALVWASMFNPEFGLINKLLPFDINWLGDGTWAKVALLITNLWLGFPYMFIVCTGALQAIPTDVKEAAAIDGASAFRTIRSVIMPLLLVAVGPLLIASFAFNFNNFGLIFLLTGGGPFEGGQSTIGSTDILITLAYRLAIGGANPNVGFAAAISVFIFFLVAAISFQGFRQTKALEDVN